MILVPFFSSECATISIPGFSQRFLQRYGPIPVARLSCLPLLPVNPFSKIRGSSSFFIPAPSSSTTSHTLFSCFFVRTQIFSPPSFLYFTLFCTSWFKINEIHFSSVYTKCSQSISAPDEWQAHPLQSKYSFP